jgi:hypothetical protein
MHRSCSCDGEASSSISIAQCSPLLARTDRVVPVGFDERSKNLNEALNWQGKRWPPE